MQHFHNSTDLSFENGRLEILKSLFPLLTYLNLKVRKAYRGNKKVPLKQEEVPEKGEKKQ